MVSVFKDGSHQRISSLARDVRDLQPGLIKDSTLMRPCVVSNQTADNSRPLATEAHPNPSIPELAEENVRGKKVLFFKRVSSKPSGKLIVAPNLRFLS
jgi:hypothetical protein